jgi:hypothetical protein
MRGLSADSQEEVMKMHKRIIVVKQGVGKTPNPLAKCCTGGVGQVKTT